MSKKHKSIAPLARIIAIDYGGTNLVRMASAICSAFPKVPDGCALICMDRLGEIPREGCRYAIMVHGKAAQRILEEGGRKK